MIFDPLVINNVELRNRVVVAPMCQYSAKEGSPTYWHYHHLLNLALAGAGLLMVESTAVNAKGRITHSDLGLYNEKQKTSLGKLVKYIKTNSNTPLCIQLSHSGRKGSSQLPWIGYRKALNLNDGSWETVAPSPIKYVEEWPAPKELDIRGMNKILGDFVRSARNADEIGFDGAELHMAHGYLLHQFLSPVSNKRTDEFGGNLINRCRFPIEIAERVRRVWPRRKILGARVTGSDWLEGGITIEDCIYLARKLENLGFDYVCVSSGGIVPETNIIFKPGYQVELAATIKKETDLIARTAGLITNVEQASAVVENGLADLVAIGRVFIRDPNWLLKSYSDRGVKSVIPKQYSRCF